MRFTLIATVLASFTFLASAAPLPGSNTNPSAVHIIGTSSVSSNAAAIVPAAAPDTVVLQRRGTPSHMYSSEQAEQHSIAAQKLKEAETHATAASKSLIQHTDLLTGAGLAFEKATHAHLAGNKAEHERHLKEHEDYMKLAKQAKTDATDSANKAVKSVDEAHKIVTKHNLDTNHPDFHRFHSGH
ncbi:hypothetical protein FRC17_002090 [Serendipita sp. 399]|nr:hypothetical protein FRC17_002090 [Serendipita sp. 399]